LSEIEGVIEHLQGLPDFTFNVDVKDDGTEESRYQNVQTLCLDEFVTKEDLIQGIKDEDHLDDEQED
jgi:hypothetical protein